ncbi:metalloregulator ArsR/SmtB family transcription factor [Pseudomonas sp. SIMBA_068]|uniref:metalloregulator ArsR/SmtB family transcription factor n=1 Tax=Pseudomonas sp. SIMBA_068 TaxID=3085808 RepID=UPI00397CD23D
MITNQSEHLQPVFIALADPTRRALLEILAKAPSHVGALAQQVPVSRSAVSQHLKVLKDAGLVQQAKRGQQRIYAVMDESQGVLKAMSNYALSLVAPAPGETDAKRTPLVIQERGGARTLDWAALNDEVDAQTVSLAGRFYVAGHRMERLLARTAAAYQLNVGEAMILGTLKRLGNDRTCTPTELGRHSLISVTGIAKRLNRLEQAGLIERTSDEEDRRSVQVRLTAAGARTFEAISHEQFTQSYVGFNALSPTQREGLDDVLESLLGTLPDT